MVIHVVSGDIDAVTLDEMEVYTLWHPGVGRSGYYMYLVSLAKEFTGQIVDIYPLPTAEHIAAVS